MALHPEELFQQLRARVIGRPVRKRRLAGNSVLVYIDALDILVGRVIHDVCMEAVSGDLHIEFEGGVLLRTFVSDPTSEELWHIRDNASAIRLRRTGRELTIHAEVA